MSKVIKNTQILVDQPRLLELVQAEIADFSTESLVPTTTPVEDELERLNSLKLETQRVLDETQEMVMELLQKARNEARGIIISAEDEAAILRQQAESEAIELTEAARSSGYEEGLKKSQQDIEADRQLALEQSQAIIEEARRTKLEILRANESDMVRLAMAVAKKIINHELTINPAVVNSIIGEAINFLDQADNLIIYVNPQDLEHVINGIETNHSFDLSNKKAQIQVLPDKKIKPGGTVVESDFGRVDARMETRITNVEQNIQEVLKDE